MTNTEDVVSLLLAFAIEEILKDLILLVLSLSFCQQTPHAAYACAQWL